MNYFRICFLCFCLIFSCCVSFVSAQTKSLAQQKFNVYKIAVEPNATKDGIRGVAVLFSCEYTFAEAEYAGMKDAEGKNYFNFYASLVNKSKETFYNGSDYGQYTKSNNTTAWHVARELAYAPQNKAQGRRNTGVELFIPFYQLDMPAGANAVTFQLNAYTAKGKKFEKIYAQPLSVTKPAAMFITLTPEQLTVVDKAGKATPVQSLEEDLFVAPGSNKTATDIAASVSADRNIPLTFIYSEGDVIRIKLQPTTRKGIVATKQVRQLRGNNGQMLTNFDNKAALRGEWTIDPKAAGVNLKNEAVQINLAAKRTKIPEVDFSDLALNTFSTHEGVAGATVSFNYEASAAAGAPALIAVPVFSSAASPLPVEMQGGKVIGGAAKLDSTGAVGLPYGQSGKVSVFYPAFNLLLAQPTIREQIPSQLGLQIRLQNSTALITQRQIQQELKMSVIQDAHIADAVTAKDTTFNGKKGVYVGIPYELPNLYAELLNGTITLQLMRASSKETRGADLLRSMTLMNDKTEKIASGSKQMATFRLNQPTGTVDLFLPYTDLTRQEKAPLAFSSRVFVSSEAANHEVEVGGNPSAIRFNLDNSKLRFVTVGISGIKLRKADTGDVAWRIKSNEGVLYQSAMIPANKTIENLYSHSYYIHEDDKVIVEMLKGKSVADAKVMMSWEKPVKELAPMETLELEPGKLSNNTDDGDTKSVTINYMAQ